jgi:hypothetical protein
VGVISLAGKLPTTKISFRAEITDADALREAVTGVKLCRCLACGGGTMPTAAPVTLHD